MMAHVTAPKPAVGETFGATEELKSAHLKSFTPSAGPASVWLDESAGAGQAEPKPTSSLAAPPAVTKTTVHFGAGVAAEAEAAAGGSDGPEVDSILRPAHSAANEPKQVFVRFGPGVDSDGPSSRAGGEVLGGLVPGLAPETAPGDVDGLLLKMKAELIAADVKHNYVKILGEVESQNKVANTGQQDFLPVFSTGLLALSRVEAGMQAQSLLPTGRSRGTLAESLMQTARAQSDTIRKLQTKSKEHAPQVREKDTASPRFRCRAAKG